jgi:hypothetical protein
MTACSPQINGHSTGSKAVMLPQGSIGANGAVGDGRLRNIQPALPTLLRLHAGELHHFAPFFDVVGEELSKDSGRTGQGRTAHLVDEVRLGESRYSFAGPTTARLHHAVLAPGMVLTFEPNVTAHNFFAATGTGIPAILTLTESSVLRLTK